MLPCIQWGMMQSSQTQMSTVAGGSLAVTSAVWVNTLSPKPSFFCSKFMVIFLAPLSLCCCCGLAHLLFCAHRKRENGCNAICPPSTGHHSQHTRARRARSRQFASVSLLAGRTQAIFCLGAQSQRASRHTSKLEQAQLSTHHSFSTPHRGLPFISFAVSSPQTMFTAVQ